jgi:predicted helicase
MDGHSQLTQLLNSIPRTTNVSYGSAFENVSDWALTHSTAYGSEIATIERFEIWAKRNGDMKARDLGIDRIVTTVDGEVWAVQNKGYDAKKNADLGDVSKFVLAAQGIPSVTRMLLVTSGPGLTANAAKALRRADSRVVVHNRRWLEEACEYPTSYSALLDKTSKAFEVEKPFILRPDQELAKAKVLRALRSTPETQLIMACGTGKTVMSEAIANGLGAKVIVFFVPSIGLMRQTIRSWQRQTGVGGMRAIAVCSDDTVGKNDDRMAWSDEDIPCEVVRSPEAIAEFINEHTGAFQARPVVVFCTYHSEHLVVRAQHEFGAPEFDFAFADEAHTLVATQEDGGRRGELVKRKDDGRKRLLARSRVYATATPRLLSKKAKQRLAAQGSDPLDSLDGSSPVFGPIAHTLTFGEAITLGVLSDYQVSIIAVPEQKYADFIHERAYVSNTKSRVLDAQTFAATEAVKLAHKLGDRRTIAYLNRKDSARSFAAALAADPELPGADAILGDMPAAQRDIRINRMNRDEGHILTNVRCLNEGVDIPALDAVMFVDPKSSPVDIGQAVGRVLRRAPGKEKGHIIIPVAVPTDNWETGVLSNEERDTAMKGPSPYKAVFDILDALASHDETIQHILTHLRLGLGKRKNADGVEVDELPDTPEELQSFLDSIVDDDGHVDKGDKATAGTTASSVLGGGKVVLYAPGMSDDMRDQFAASLRLAVVRESRNSIYTWEDHLYHFLVYGQGYSWTEAAEELRQSRASVHGVKEAA